MGKSSAPKAPNYANEAAAQGAENRSTALFNAGLNRVNQVGPYGSFTYSPIQGPTTVETITQGGGNYGGAAGGGGSGYNPMMQYGRILNNDVGMAPRPGQEGMVIGTDREGNPIYGNPQQSSSTTTRTIDGSMSGGTMTMNLAPEQQALLEATNFAKLGVASGTNTSQGAVDRYTRQLREGPDGEHGISQGEDARKAMVDAVYKSYTANLDPRYAQEETSKRNALIQQGLTEGSEGYQTQMRNWMQNRDSAYQQASNQSVIQGDASQQQAFQQSLAKYGLIQSDYANYMNNIAPTLPQMYGTPTAGGAASADLLGAANSQYKAASDAANVKNANNASLWQAAGTAAAFMF